MSGKAKRVVFGYSGSDILEFPVEISWDLGWDRESKLEYIDRIRRQVYEQYGIDDALDVTTANCTFENGRILSPHILRYPGMDKDIITVMRNGNEYMPTDNISRLTYIYCYMYAICHNQTAYDVFRRYEYFFDVFWKPDEKGDTQAKLCVLLKIIIGLKLHKEFFEKNEAGNIIAFKKWYEGLKI